MKLQKADLKRITKLFIKQKNFNHGIQPWVRNLHMEILMLLTIKPRIQRQLNSGPLLLQMMILTLPRRYGENGFYLQHYTTQGKPAGARGNKAEVTAAANQYLEDTPTDADLQAARTLQLGVDTDTQTERLLNIPTVASEWEKAKRDDPYWKEQAKEKFLDVNKPDEFAALFRLSDRPEDQIVRLNYNANAGYGITELDDAIGEAVGEKILVV
jgi:hypothetical protein